MKRKRGDVHEAYGTFGMTVSIEKTTITKNLEVNVQNRNDKNGSRVQLKVKGTFQNEKRNFVFESK